MGIQTRSRKNQIVISKEAREAMGVKGGDMLLVIVEGDVTVLKPEPNSYKVFGASRRGYTLEGI